MPGTIKSYLVAYMGNWLDCEKDGDRNCMSNTTDEWAWLDEFLDIGHDREDGTEYRSQAKQSIKSHLEQMMREREQAIQLPQFFIEALINGLHKEAEYYREAGYKGLPHNFQNRMNKLQALTKEEDK